MNNITFQNIPRKLELLKNDIDDPIIKKLYSNYSFSHLFCNYINQENENKELIQNLLKIFLIDYLKKYKFLTYDQIDLLGTSKSNPNITSIESYTIICIEKQCLIIENIEKQLIDDVLNEINSTIINITQKSDEILVKEEISSFCLCFTQLIKSNLFVKLTINSIIGYSIRRYFYPSSFFNDKSFFIFDQQTKNSELFDQEISNNMTEIFEAKNEIDIKIKIQEFKSKMFEINNINYQPQIYEFKESDFIILRTIEINETFVFYLVIHIESFYIFLLKKIIYFKDENKINHEINFCNNYKHHCFTRFYGFLKEKEKIIGFVYEFMCNGNLSKYIRSQSKIETDIIYSIFTLMRIFEGIEYLHSNSLVHRDIKPSNVLLDHNFIPYISDFETIRKIEVNQSKKDFTFDFVSILYSSPEQYNNEIISYSTDIFSFGLIVYFLFEKKDMIQFENEAFIYDSIKNRKIPHIENVSVNIQKLYSENVYYDKEKRLSLKENKKLIIDEILSQSNIDYCLFEIDKKLNEIIMYFVEIIHFITNNYELLNIFFDNFSKLSLLLKNENISTIFLNLGNSYFLGQEVEQNFYKARKYYELSAKFNNSAAFNNLAVLFYKGLGVEEDLNKAKENYEKAIKLKNSTSAFYLGHFYLSRDNLEAFKYFELAAKLKNPNAQFFLGYLYFEGETYFKHDPIKAINFLEQSKNDIPLSLFLLGYIYMSNEYIEKDYTKAIEYFDLYEQKKIEINPNHYYINEGNITSNFFNEDNFYNLLINILDLIYFCLLGARCQLGEGVNQSFSKAKYFYEIAAEKNFPVALLHLGNLYSFGLGCNRDYAKAKQYYELSYTNGLNSESLNNIGILYQYGLGVDINYIKAKKYFELSAYYSNSYALLNLGFQYINGQGVIKDFHKAKYYFEMSAKLNNGNGMFYLGYMYDNGIGVSIDYKKAKYYYELAAEKNCSNAFLNLGVLYYTGRLDKVDYKKAKEYFELAAKLNNNAALFNLGDIYQNGLGVPVDYNRAKYYYELIINKDDSESLIASRIQNVNDKEFDFLNSLNSFEVSFYNIKAYAYVNLADLYFDEKYFDFDYQKAIKYLKRATKFRNSEAFLMLGDIYSSGKGVKKDDLKALKYYKKSAKLINQIAMNKLGIIYLKGQFVRQNYLKATLYFNLSSELNNLESFYYLGCLYSSGEFFDIDINKSIEYFKKCTQKDKYYIFIKDYNLNTSKLALKYNKNYDQSFNEIGLIYIIHLNNKELALNYLQKAAFAEFPFAQNNYGLLLQYYYNNIKEARYMYERSAQHKFSMAEFNLAKLYEEENDIEKAIYYYIQTSNHESECLEFHGNKIDDDRLEISKIFIICLTNLILVNYFYWKEKEKSDFLNIKKYFIKAILKLIDKNEYPFTFAVNENEFNCLYLKLFILNYPLFNLPVHLNEISDFQNLIKSSMKIKNKGTSIKQIKFQDKKTYVLDENINETVFDDPNSLFDFIFKNFQRIESFIKIIKEIIEIMKSILNSPPFSILFGRIAFPQIKSTITINKENINSDFYEGFGIDISE